MAHSLLLVLRASFFEIVARRERFMILIKVQILDLYLKNIFGESVTSFFRKIISFHLFMRLLDLLASLQIVCKCLLCQLNPFPKAFLIEPNLCVALI